jgi:hypothetical protein
MSGAAGIGHEAGSLSPSGISATKNYSADIAV